jgi:nitronate monooxygenase
MVIEGMKAVCGRIPALNYRTLEELRASIIELREAKVLEVVWL